MGYPTEQFLASNIVEAALCAICQDVLEDVKMINPCEHVFCGKCLSEWMQRNKICPIDRGEIVNVRNPPQWSVNLLNSLEKFCEFNSAGCPDVIKLDDAKLHSQRCDFNPANAQVCMQQCGAVLKPSAIDGHNCIHYLKEELSKFKIPVPPPFPPLRPYKPSIRVILYRNYFRPGSDIITRIVADELRKETKIVLNMDEPFKIGVCYFIEKRIGNELGGDWDVEIHFSPDRGHVIPEPKMQDRDRTFIAIEVDYVYFYIWKH